MDDIYRLLIIVGILAVQYFFSTRNNVFWGAIIPASYIVFLTWMFVTDRIESTVGFILYLLLGLLFLIAEWSAGRKALNQKRKKELDKIKTHDMK
ncbi:hypothetical protein MNQ98_03040 [Paenibacillus sp. N3/727]|uniref:hypothetical protein n=1 Tax=Paenibacillus sp. N3/727 TaxID=2925845 RepID=UPI001F533FC6|nr:hypothetical protein [Paenibacillus sp. N3/727]UNK19036.1 hypothetical protein MNQ98_03040 [Paenibacillus sp. N3/727]